MQEQLSAKENKVTFKNLKSDKRPCVQVIQLNGEVAELRRKVFDLEENLSEKEQVWWWW